MEDSKKVTNELSSEIITLRITPTELRMAAKYMDALEPHNRDRNSDQLKLKAFLVISLQKLGHE